MSMISELVENLRDYANGSLQYFLPKYICESLNQAADTIEELSAKLSASQMARSSQYYNGGWVPCEERLPEEHDSCLAKWYGTNRWNAETMWRKQSDDVLVTMEFEDGTRKTEKMNTHDGKWFYDIYVVKFKVIAWRPLPEPYMEVQDETD